MPGGAAPAVTPCPPLAPGPRCLPSGAQPCPARTQRGSGTERTRGSRARGSHTRGAPARAALPLLLCPARRFVLPRQGLLCYSGRASRGQHARGSRDLSGRAGQRNTDHTSQIRDRWGSGLFPQHQQPRTKERKGGENNICSGPPSARL